MRSGAASDDDARDYANGGDQFEVRRLKIAKRPRNWLVWLSYGTNLKHIQITGELKSQICCQEQQIADLQHMLQSNKELIAGLQGIVEEDGVSNESLNVANENFVEAQRRIEELEVANKNYADLAEENRECSICNEPRQTNQFKVFNPCGHRTCELCIPNFRGQCPFCRTPIQCQIPFIPVNNT